MPRPAAFANILDIWNSRFHIEANSAKNVILCWITTGIGRRQQVGAVITDHQVDFVDIEQLGENPATFAGLL